MKRPIVALCAALALTACAGSGARQPEGGRAENTEKTEKNETAGQTGTSERTREAIAASSFGELFEEIAPKEVGEDIFTLVGERFGILTAGAPGEENAMVTSWGGWGIVFGQPGMFHFLRSNRYTLEKMRAERCYTVSFFEEGLKEEIMPFGMSSGRDTDKMKQTTLTTVRTPDGLPAWKEASIIVECRLAEVTTVAPDDFYDEENRRFVEEAYAETHDWHKLVLSRITHVWRRK